MDFTTSQPGDTEDIVALFKKTFSDSEGAEEGLLIGNLVTELLTRTRPEDVTCFVAKENDQIVGSIIFSRLTFKGDVRAFLMAPVAVHTSYQGKGIGQRLITFGLETLKKNGVELAVTYGDPYFYEKVGFQPISEDIIKAPMKLTYPEGWLAQSLVGNEIEPIPGDSKCVEAFNKAEYW